ncbi:MAG: DNA translocase FtsK 4TM domain-containing protein [Candidatus Saccharibacteria bacterium]|nr:DNA translocase FtsK 4TM domain-containing protein [Candidatus Saccharibacteria bacterium]
MAKKRGRKKKTTKKEVAAEHELPGGFWRQVFAVLMIAVALFLVVTWFGHGGSVLNKVHDWAYYAIGLATYIIPLLLVFLAIKIFRSDNNKLALPIWFAAVLMVIWVAGIAGIGEMGGVVGKWLDSVTTQVLDRSVAILIYVILIFITVLFILQLSPLTFFKGTKNLLKSNKKVEHLDTDTDDGKTKGKKLGDIEIKVNSGVAVADSAKMPVKAAAKAPAQPVEEKALVAVSDPNWKMPSMDLLAKKQSPADAGNIQQNAYVIRSTLADFGIEVEMEGANVGPRVTQYTMRPPAGVALSKILTHDKELALNLAVKSVRIEAPIPGTSLVGVEIPNVKAADVRLRSILESPDWKNSTDPLTFAVGKDISGRAVVANLAKMPHLLIAGTTGSGKSVMTNAMIVSLLYRNSPSDMKLIVIDPKQVEMVQYTDIPHLLTPIITETTQAVSALKWAVNEMERRYSLLAKNRVKNIAEYNKMIEKDNAEAKEPKEGEESDKKDEQSNGKMPYIVIVIDEMSDLMMQASKELEPSIVRVAQKGRAAGLHLVLATQKPIVKVVTGLIKGNVPARIAFSVGSTMDSIVMLDKAGAEKLLGSGDMLFLTTEMSGQPRRIQGAWVSDEEEEKVANFLKSQRPPEYNNDVISQPVQIKGLGPSDGGAFGDLGRKYDPNDPIVRRAVEISLAKGKFSTAMLQTYLGKGHGFVSGLAIWFEEIGVIGAANGNKPRDLLITSMEEFDEITNML